MHNASTLPTRLVAVAVASAVAVAGELRGEEVNRSLDRSAGVESSEWESGGGTWRWSCPGRRGNQDEHFKCDCKPRNHADQQTAGAWELGTRDYRICPTSRRKGIGMDIRVWGCEVGGGNVDV